MRGTLAADGFGFDLAFKFLVVGAQLVKLLEQLGGKFGGLA